MRKNEVSYPCNYAITCSNINNIVAGYTVLYCMYTVNCVPNTIAATSSRGPRAGGRGRGVSHWHRRRPRLVAGGGGFPLSIISLSIRLSVSLTVSGVAVYDGAEGRLIPVCR